MAITGRKLDVVQAACESIKARFGVEMQADRSADQCRARRGHRGRAHRARHRRRRHHAARGGAVAGQPHAGTGGGRQCIAAGRHRRRGAWPIAAPQATARSCSARWASARSSSRCIAPASRRLFEQNDLLLDAEEIYALAKTDGRLNARERETLDRSPKLHREFLDDLASGDPTPGGGSAAAIMGAMGAALVSMVCNVSFGKKGYEAAEPEMRACSRRSEALRRRLTAMVGRGYRRLRQLDGRVQAAQSHRRGEGAARRGHPGEPERATEVPLDCARVCAEVIALARRAGEHGYLARHQRRRRRRVGRLCGAAQRGAQRVHQRARAQGPRFAANAIEEVERLAKTSAVESEAVYAAVRNKLES